ncbi:MAG: DUF47 family protein [Candidatus Woesearchaeota archaeon]|jgi:hypothetical protein|nr:DUF47 family protein [Candidatus Woesearchaeota archaeon]MDP7622506.1 DUF47 family protein [Candidatus Woesearchaeota archaeon]HJN56596.1 DUF47 family protein [Candidatus Woesearchaeota archaeon]|tara:strand:- start:37585 stop:38223 length:639 start_codon:yes stop_codon:yes gene_type:complete
MANIIHWLLPKEEKFFHMLKKQSFNVVKGANEFKGLVENYNKLSYPKKKALVKEIKQIESNGDSLTHEIIKSLDRTFITPIDKEDIHRLTMLLDDVIDLIYATSERLIIFKIKKIDKFIIDFTKIILEIVKRIDNGILDVRKLKNMNNFYIQVHTLENKGDEIYYNALEKLFENKNTIEIIKIKEIYEYLENIIDKCEDIANVIESIVVKHA